MIYAVIDTNVFVAALLSHHSDTATVKVVGALAENRICPLYNQEIISEYIDVLNRPKFKFPQKEIKKILDRVLKIGQNSSRMRTNEHFPDPKDIVFYEVAMSKEDAYLVTGNTKHFPKKPIVVTPSEMLEIMESRGII